MAHRIGTGYIREVLRSVISPQTDPHLHRYSFDDPMNGVDRSPLAMLKLQAARLRPAIEACIARSRREGTSIVIEGTHLVPGMVSMEGVSVFVVLTAPDRQALAFRATGSTHSRRLLTPAQIERIVELQRQLVDLAHREGVPVVNNDRLEAAVEEVLRYVKAAAAR